VETSENWFPRIALDNTLDHKFMIDINDPLFETLLPHYKDNPLHKMEQNYKIPNLNIIKNEPNHIKEMYQGYIIVDFVPTSENLLCVVTSNSSTPNGKD